MRYEFTLLKKQSKLLRLDVFPFIGIYGGCLYLWTNFLEEDIYGRLLFLGVGFIHLVVFLSTYWSVSLRAKIAFTKVQSISDAKFVFVTYKKKGRKTLKEICELKEDSIYFFLKKFYYDFLEKKFVRLKPEITKEISFYKKPFIQPHFDKNLLNVPIKPFMNLLKDQLLEPFSFFQFVSVALWLIDENWYYPLFTIVMLFMSSFMMVLQRMKTMLTLKMMKLQPQYITVYREKKWVKISSEDLFPGDICMLQPSSSLKKFESTSHEQELEEIIKEIPFVKALPPKFWQTDKGNSNSYKYVPADILLLSGNCVVNESMLTGESVPQVKDPLSFDSSVHLDTKGKNKFSMLYCGTEVLQAYPCENDNAGLEVSLPSGSNACLGYVLKTGFDTSKGKLIRTVTSFSDSILVQQADSFFLLGVLLIFSIITSFYVLKHGLEDQTRDRNKLFLRCIMIITTVVPPELPMILSIAVNTSLQYLQRKKIFCTEPFRITLAGKTEYCAFDKTGTLTEDKLEFRGIAIPEGKEIKLKQLNEIGLETESVLAGCHSIIQIDKKQLGDPLDLLFFQNSKWNYSATDKSATSPGKDTVLSIRKLYPFRSENMRMTTVVHRVSKGQREFMALTKGAPEVIKDLLKETPENYDSCYQKYSRLGFRVIALACKALSDFEIQNQDDRTVLECNLVFCGFLVCESPLKPKTKEIIGELLDSNYKCIMITGDNILTAANVAKDLSMGPQSFATLGVSDGNLQWVLNSGQEETPLKSFNPKEILLLRKENLLCASGEAIETLHNDLPSSEFRAIIQLFQVFARTSPSQKSLIIETLKGFNHAVLMCGDGTNDVGALKKADVGIALATASDGTASLKPKKKAAIGSDSLLEEEGYNFGDACIAAPFTSKNPLSIKCVLLILRQGVCTIVTSIQTYKMLALSSLLSAYSLSSLHMQALKFSDFQSTILGISAAASYFYFSNSKPLRKLSKEKPIRTIVHPYFIASVVSQVAFHLVTLHYTLHHIGLVYSSKEQLEVKHDEEFKPAFLNTIVFLFSWLSQTIIFLINNGGEPFMRPLTENKKYFKMLLLQVGACLFLSLNILPDFNYIFELDFKGIPFEANLYLFGMLVFCTLGNYLVELVLKLIFHKKIYNWI